MSLEQTSSTAEDILLQELKYDISPSASYLLQKEQTKWFAAGSNIYNASSGQRVLRFNLSGSAPLFLNPQSVKLMFTLVNNGTKLLIPLTGPWGFFQRCTIKVNGVQAEDIYGWNRVTQQFHTMQNVETRQRDLDLGGGGGIEEYGQTTMHAYEVGEQRTVMCPIFSGLFTGNSKYFWLSAMNITVELELAHATANLLTPPNVAGDALQTSVLWHIEDAQILGDVVTVSPDLLSVYTAHLESGKSMSIEYKTFAVSEHAIAPGSDTSINLNRAFTKLDGILTSFATDSYTLESTGATTLPVWTDSALKSWYSTSEVVFYPGMASSPLGGIAKAEDVLEMFISIGPRRFPNYPVTKLTEHYLRFHQFMGRLTSDAHAWGGGAQKGMSAYMFNQLQLGTDLEKSHPGSGAAYTGENTRHNDLTTVHLKNLNSGINKCFIIMVHLQILKISAAGADVLD